MKIFISPFASFSRASSRRTRARGRPLDRALAFGV